MIARAKPAQTQVQAIVEVPPGTIITDPTGNALGVTDTRAVHLDGVFYMTPGMARQLLAMQRNACGVPLIYH